MRPPPTFGKHSNFILVAGDIETGCNGDLAKYVLPIMDLGKSKCENLGILGTLLVFLTFRRMPVWLITADTYYSPSFLRHGEHINFDS